MNYGSNENKFSNNTAQMYKVPQEVQASSSVNYADVQGEFKVPAQPALPSANMHAASASTSSMNMPSTSKQICSSSSMTKSVKGTYVTFAEGKASFRNQKNHLSMIATNTPRDDKRMSPIAGPSRIQDVPYYDPRSVPLNNQGAGSSNSAAPLQNAGPSGVPKPASTSAVSNYKKNGTEQKARNETGACSNYNVRLFGTSDREKMFIFTGTVEKLIRWHKIFKNHFCYFEVIASFVSLQEGNIRTQKIMLLRNTKGPILQVVYYATTHMAIENFHVGQNLRCVGNMTGTNILNAVSIRNATDEEVETLQRISSICENAISHFLKP